MVQEKANPGFQAGIGQRSKTQRLAWALKGAPLRKKDLQLNAVTGIAEGRKLRDRVTALMRDAGANPEDATVSCVFAEPDLSGLVKQVAQLQIQNGASDLKLATRFVDKQPIGFLVFVWDRQERAIFGHVRPLIVEDPRAAQYNEQAFKAYERKLKATLAKAGLIADESN